MTRKRNLSEIKLAVLPAECPAPGEKLAIPHRAAKITVFGSSHHALAAVHQAALIHEVVVFVAVEVVGIVVIVEPPALLRHSVLPPACGSRHSPPRPPPPAPPQHRSAACSPDRTPAFRAPSRRQTSARRSPGSGADIPPRFRTFPRR